MWKNHCFRSAILLLVGFYPFSLSYCIFKGLPYHLQTCTLDMIVLMCKFRTEMGSLNFYHLLYYTQFMSLKMVKVHLFYDNTYKKAKSRIWDTIVFYQ